jgi:hypothetical protein
LDLRRANVPTFASAAFRPRTAIRRPNSFRRKDFGIFAAIAVGNARKSHKRNFSLLLPLFG